MIKAAAIFVFCASAFVLAFSFLLWDTYKWRWGFW